MVSKSFSFVGHDHETGTHHVIHNRLSGLQQSSIRLIPSFSRQVARLPQHSDDPIRREPTCKTEMQKRTENLRRISPKYGLTLGYDWSGMVIGQSECWACIVICQRVSPRAGREGCDASWRFTSYLNMVSHSSMSIIRKGDIPRPRTAGDSYQARPFPILVAPGAFEVHLGLDVDPALGQLDHIGHRLRVSSCSIVSLPPCP